MLSQPGPSLKGVDWVAWLASHRSAVGRIWVCERFVALLVKAQDVRMLAALPGLR